MARFVLASIVICFVASSTLAWYLDPCATRTCNFGEVCEVRNRCDSYSGSCSLDAVCVGGRSTNIFGGFCLVGEPQLVNTFLPASYSNIVKCTSDYDCGINYFCSQPANTYSRCCPRNTGGLFY